MIKGLPVFMNSLNVWCQQPTRPSTRYHTNIISRKCTRLQRLIEKFLYYCRAIGATMAVSLNKLSAHETMGTEALTKYITRFLNYCATHPNVML